jgi:hypothetical protein
MISYSWNGVPIEDDNELLLGKAELRLALARMMHLNPSSSERAETVDTMISVIDDYITLKIAIALEMMADRIEAATNVRP